MSTRFSEDVATVADVLDMVGWKKEAEMLRGYMGLCLLTAIAVHVGV